MAIPNVVTRGFGPSASIPFVVTAGYSIGAAGYGPDIELTVSINRTIELEAAINRTIAEESELT